MYDFDPREVVILEMAARQSDNIAALDKAIRTGGVMVEGSKGQPRLAHAVVEVRQARLALSRLLGELSLPSVDEKPMTARSERSKRAAEIRWTRVRRVREQREARGGTAS